LLSAEKGSKLLGKNRRSEAKKALRGDSARLEKTPTGRVDEPQSIRDFS
jgi:hypothetical protein